MTGPLFLCKMSKYHIKKIMDKAKLKLIIRNMELLLDSLKSEVYSDVNAYKQSEELVGSTITSYDEVFEDDDG